MNSKISEFKEKLTKLNNRKKALIISGICVGTMSLGIVGYQNSFRYQLSFNNQEIGTVQEKAIADSAFVQIEKEVSEKYGEKAYFKKEIKLQKVRADKDKLLNEEQLAQKIRSSLEIYKPAAIITVDNEEKLILESKEQADEILEDIKNSSIEKIDTNKDKVKVVEASFKQDVKVIEKDVPVDQIQTEEDAIKEVDKNSQQIKTHKIALGENAWNISRSYNVGMNKLEDVNKDKDMEDLMPGDQVKIPVESSFVDVETIVNQTETVAVAFKVEEQNTNDLYKGQQKVKQEGKKGEKVVVKELTYVNDELEGQKVIKETVTKEPTNKIVLKGTKKRPVTVSRSSGSRKAAPTYNGNLGSAIVSTARGYIGVPYVRGGSTPRGFDCSGFTKYVFAQYGINIPRTSGGQGGVGGYVAKGDLRPGDLVIFSGHVGISLGGSSFIHSPSPGKSVMISSVNSGYWSSRFISGRRVN